MFEKLFSYPKRYWVMLHVLELVLGFLVLIGLNPHIGIEVLPWSQMIVSYISTFVFFVAISVATFPISAVMVHSLGEIFERLSEYASILLLVLPFFIYYALWLIPDSKWSEKQKYWVVRLRIFWFLISSIAAWVAVFQPL